MRATVGDHYGDQATPPTIQEWRIWMMAWINQLHLMRNGKENTPTKPIALLITLLPSPYIKENNGTEWIQLVVRYQYDLAPKDGLLGALHTPSRGAAARRKGKDGDLRS